jgi:hypothetical protein
LPLPAALHRAEDHPGAGLLIGCWALAGVLLNISKSSGTVTGGDWLWAVIAFALAQLAYLERVRWILGRDPAARSGSTRRRRCPGR